MNLTAKLLLNSLYGRFGMDDEFIVTSIMTKKEFALWEKQDGAIEALIDFLPLGDKYLVQSKSPKAVLKTQLDKGKETHNINIAIACAVTAYARIHMSQFKNNSEFPNLYYTDTDSLYFDGPLPDKFISNTELGALKLEGIWDNAIFLAPKVYALRNKDCYATEIIKIKGLSKQAINSNNITFDSLLPLLNKEYNLIYNQDKWFKSLTEGTIDILEQTYTFKATGNKRQLIYINNVLTDTAQLNINIEDNPSKKLKLTELY